MKIQNEETIQALLDALADKRKRIILKAASYDAVSAMEIIRDEGLPVSSTYRLLSEMQEQGLIGVERSVVPEDGKTYDLYKASFVNIQIIFNGGKFFVEAEINRNIVEKAFRFFHSFEEL